MEEEDLQRSMNINLGNNAMKDASKACTKGEFASARRLLGLAEACYSRAGLDPAVKIDEVCFQYFVQFGAFVLRFF